MNGGALVSSSSKWHIEVIALGAQLTSSVKLQIENTQSGIHALGVGQDSIADIRIAMARVVELCQQSERLFTNYNTIKQVSRTAARFAMIRGIYDQFCRLDETLARVTKFLEEDKEAGSPENLLLIYAYLSRLDEFRTSTNEMVKDAPSTLLYTLRRYFKRLDDVMVAFEYYYWKLPTNLFAWVQNGRGDVIVKILKVLQKLIKSDGANRSRFLTHIDDFVSNKFAGLSIAPDEPTTILEAFAFYKEDLSLVRDELVSRFPPDFNIMDIYVLTYHRNIYGLISQVLSRKLGPADILQLLGWVDEYYSSMLSDFGMQPEDIEPHLLGDQEQVLVDDYVRLSRAKVTDWIHNLLNAEKKNFTERSAPPDTDSNDRYITPAAVDLFQIVKQHVDTVIPSSKGKLLAEVVRACCDNVIAFQNDILDMITKERGKFFDKKEKEKPKPHFEDYLIMMGNSCLRWIECMDELTRQLEGCLGQEYLAQAQRQLKTCNEGFFTVARGTTEVLVDIIMDSVRPAVAELFTTAWYSGSSIDTIMATFEDFFRDYKTHSEQFLYAKLVADVLERLIITYIEMMRGKASKLRIQACPSVFAGDLATIYRVFSIYREPKRVEKTLDSLTKLVAVITASKKMVFLEFFSFWKSYPDVSLPLLEEILLRRDDLDKSAVKDIMDSCRQKSREEKIIEASPSIFSKISAK